MNRITSRIRIKSKMDLHRILAGKICPTSCGGSLGALQQFSASWTNRRAANHYDW
jgi:hypothetical protein